MQPVTEMTYEDFLKEHGFADSPTVRLAYKLIREEEAKSQAEARSEIKIPPINQQRKAYSEEEKRDAHYREHC